MGKTSIQWTGYTWSPLRARVKADAAAIARARGYTSLIQIAEKMAGHAGPHCEHVSHGCDNCYSDTNNSRCLPTQWNGIALRPALSRFDRSIRRREDPASATSLEDTAKDLRREPERLIRRVGAR